jgi:acyl-CoA thioesterase-2
VTTAPQQAVTLEQILDLEPLDRDLFRGRTRPTQTLRTFGGEVASQALVAAGRTVDGERGVHSLHAYFLRPGNPKAPLIYRVDRIRDGGSFTTRRVVATQSGEAVFHLSASFQAPEAGSFHHQVPQLTAPAPDQLPPGSVVMADADPANREWFSLVSAMFPLEIRFPEELPRFAAARGEVRPPRQRIWVRAAHRLPDDPLWHACAATYASDLFLLGTSGAPHGVVIGTKDIRVASLDHAVWFHDPFRADDWLLIDMESTWAGHGRALCRSSFFRQDGVLVASVVQEGMVRRVTRA